MRHDLYTTDFVTWSTEQADKLRRLSEGEQVNDIDWPNVVMEVADLGKSETNAVRSLLARAMEHVLRAVAFPAAPDPRGWLLEAATFLQDAKRRWTPGMDQLLDLRDIYADAHTNVLALSYREGPPEKLPDRCPAGLRDLLPKGRARADMDALLALFRTVREGDHAE